MNIPLEIQILQAEANRDIQFELVRESGETLYISTISFYFYNKIRETGLRLSNFGVGIYPFILRYNKIPKNFDTEWAVKGKQGVNGGNLYLLNGELVSNQQDTVISNNPLNLMSANINYHFPDSIETNGIISIHTLLPDFHYWGNGDIQYLPPVQLTVYQDTSASIELRSSTFIQFVYASNLAICGYIFTPEIRLGSSKITGYFYLDRETVSFPVSENPNNVHLGLTPAYWFGKFFNKQDTIQIGSPYGRWQHLFLSQSNDALRHFDVDYQITHNGNVVKQGKFPPFSPCPIMFLGFNPEA